MYWLPDGVSTHILMAIYLVVIGLRACPASCREPLETLIFQRGFAFGVHRHFAVVQLSCTQGSCSLDQHTSFDFRGLASL